MIIFPAIDLLNQSCVRLTQGDYNQVEVFNSDPVAQAKLFESQGAKFLHMVDLDGAKEGSQKNFEVIKKSKRINKYSYTSWWRNKRRRKNKTSS
jgi:phosphoribosylformimino-5-aminoimidazole carboxamide ribotide isomerase